VINPERPPRYLSLAEAFAIALEQGTTGLGLQGQPNDNLPTFQGPQQGPLDRDSIRVLALEPAVAQSNIEAALSKFDARWVTSMNWNNTDRPVGTALDAFQAAAGALNSIETADAQFRTALIKPLATGGVAGITFNTDYQFTNLPARVNPSYRPALQFQFEQPLLQGYGVEINQLRADHPGSILQGSQFQTRPLNAQEGILLSRIRFDQARADFERNVQNMLLNVEIAYWRLYAAYGELFAREIALRNNLDVWRVTKDRVEAGQKGFTQADLYQALGQYESSRSEWLGALGSVNGRGVLAAERDLRALLNLPAEDGTRLVPADSPALAPYQPDWQTALQETLTLKPELVLVRDQLKAAQLNVVQVKNFLMPDLRFTATYDINAIGNHLSGPDADNAFRNLASNHFNNWSLGLRLDVPIGFRDAHAGVRAARLRLAQAYWSLRLNEDRAERYLALQYRNVIEAQRHIAMNLSSVQAYNRELEVRFERARSGQELFVDITLQSIRLGTAALIQYYQFVASYNSSLANYEWAKGTLLQRNNIVIAEGPLPGCAQVRACEHERERSKALVLREREVPPARPGCDGQTLGVPLPSPETLSLPELMRSRPALPPELYEGLPPPRPVNGDKTSAPSLDPAPATALPPAKPAPERKAPAVPVSRQATPPAPGAMKVLTFPDDEKGSQAPPGGDRKAPAAGSRLTTPPKPGEMKVLTFPEDDKAPQALPPLPALDAAPPRR
jgi:outer membrane protein TolC